MPEVTGSSPVGSTIFICAVLLFSFLSPAAEIEAELGWWGIVVWEAVNPLWITIRNPSPLSLEGALVISREIGSPWRGRAHHSLELEVLLPPHGGATYLLPWQLLPGERYLRLSWSARDGFRTEKIPIPPAAEGLVGHFGNPPEAPPYPTVALSPSQLPPDPVLLTPFRDISLTPGLPNELLSAIAAWETYLDRSISPAFPSRDAVRLSVEEVPLRSSPLMAVGAATALYLLLLSSAMRRLAKGTGYGFYAVVVITAIGLAFGAGRPFMRGEVAVKVIWEFHDRGAPDFSLRVAAVAAKDPQEWTLEGLWFELMPREGGSWEGRDIHWEVAPTGSSTSFPVSPGSERIMWSLSKWEGEPVRGKRYTVLSGSVGLPDGTEMGVERFLRTLPVETRPLIRALLGELPVGSSFSLVMMRERRGDHVALRFVLELERG